MTGQETLQGTAFDEVVASFYRAASGEIGWREALERARTVVRADWVMQLTGVDSQGGIVFSYESGVASPEAAFDWIRDWHRYDPRTARLMQQPEQGWIHCDELLDERAVAASPFYQEFLIPHGGRWVSGVKLHQDQSLAVLWAVLNGVGSTPLDAVERSVAQRLAIHLGEAVKQYVGHHPLRQQAGLGAQLLHRLSHPALLVDDLRFIRDANAPARLLLRERLVLQERDGLLAGRGHDTDAQLSLAMRSLRLAGDAFIERTAGEDRLFVRLRDGSGQPFGLYLFALQPQATLGAFGGQSLALVLVHDPRAHRAPDPFLVAATWNLTPAEARVAVALAGGLSAEAIALRHRVAVGTVRSQIKSALAKTGQHRQSELVSLVLSMPAGPG